MGGRVLFWIGRALGLDCPLARYRSVGEAGGTGAVRESKGGGGRKKRSKGSGQFIFDRKSIGPKSNWVVSISLGVSSAHPRPLIDYWHIPHTKSSFIKAKINRSIPQPKKKRVHPLCFALFLFGVWLTLVRPPNSRGGRSKKRDFHLLSHSDAS